MSPVVQPQGFTPTVAQIYFGADSRGQQIVDRGTHGALPFQRVVSILGRVGDRLMTGCIHVSRSEAIGGA